MKFKKTIRKEADSYIKISRHVIHLTKGPEHRIIEHYLNENIIEQVILSADFGVYCTRWWNK